MTPRAMMPPPQAQGQPQTLTVRKTEIDRDRDCVHMHPSSFSSVLSKQLQVPDKLIGSVLGKGGLTLKEMQQQTGARITISKRGEYAPGTQNR